MANSDMVQSVLKALDILRAATQAPNGVRLNELCEALDLKKSTAHNLMRTLCARGFLVKDSANRFLPGVAIQELARLRRSNMVINAASKQIRLLRKAFPRATLTFSELAPNAIHCRLRMSADRPGELQHPLEYLFAPYVTATAVCLQATGNNAAEFERHFPFQEHGIARWESYESFLDEKERVRKNGYAVNQYIKQFAIAFAAPENFAIGFSMEAPPADFFHRLQSHIERFRAALREANDAPAAQNSAPAT
jgi:DNA-binding IclR family transcriptional regulator